MKRVVSDMFKEEKEKIMEEIVDKLQSKNESINQ